MEHKKIPGLFFAEELLDIDAITGGFNLQAAGSTGYLAAVSISEK
jgi:predicted flavoprotein YhiN